MAGMFSFFSPLFPASVRVRCQKREGGLAGGGVRGLERGWAGGGWREADSGRMRTHKHTSTIADIPERS